MDKILKASDVVDEYNPTPEERRNIRILPDHFLLSGDGIFHTIQGEGTRSGRPITFIRLHHCNLNCGWCDAYYTWDKRTEEFWTEPENIHIDTITQLVEDEQERYGIHDKVKRVCFTGGEPLIQQQMIERFIRENQDYEVEIETNGTIMPSAYLIDQAHTGRVNFNCSPKIANSGVSYARRFKPDVLESLGYIPSTIFKFVCKDKEDVMEVLTDFEFLRKDQISIMPEGVTKEENARVYEEILPIILRYGLNTHVRSQNILFDGARRGV